MVKGTKSRKGLWDETYTIYNNNDYHDNGLDIVLNIIINEKKMVARETTSTEHKLSFAQMIVGAR